MANVVQAFTWTNGVVATAVNMNANPAAFVAAFKNIDNTNVGAAGFFPSQLIALNSAQGTFGGTVGLTIAPGNASVVPLTVSGVAGQTATALQVTAGWTIIADAVRATPGLVAGDLVVAESATSGALYFGNSATLNQASYISASGNVLQFGPARGGAATAIVGATFTATNTLYVSNVSVTAPSVPALSSTGDVIAQRTVSAGALHLGGSTAGGVFDFGLGTAGQYSARNESGAFPQFNGGVYNNASDANLKKNIAPLADTRETILALKPVSFDWKHDGSPSLGFLAQDVQAVLPELVSTSVNGTMGVNYDGMIPVVVAQQQDMLAKLHAAGIAGF